MICTNEIPCKNTKYNINIGTEGYSVWQTQLNQVVQIQYILWSIMNTNHKCYIYHSRVFTKYSASHRVKMRHSKYIWMIKSLNFWNLHGMITLEHVKESWEYSVPFTNFNETILTAGCLKFARSSIISGHSWLSLQVLIVSLQIPGWEMLIHLE